MGLTVCGSWQDTQQQDCCADIVRPMFTQHMVVMLWLSCLIRFQAVHNVNMMPPLSHGSCAGCMIREPRLHRCDWGSVGLMISPGWHTALLAVFVSILQLSYAVCAGVELCAGYHLLAAWRQGT